MILEIVLGFICVVFFLVIMNLNRKIESLEDNTEFYESYINSFAERIENASERLKVIDNKGTFEGDDEVGFFFTYVKELQKDIAILIGQTDEGEKDDEESNNPVN
tara:strand:+ start:1560 stop:1874 length:315 start_codon:yes stop_codon:yes gene_type:complete